MRTDYLRQQVKGLPPEDQKMLLDQLLTDITVPQTNLEQFELRLMADFTDQAISLYENFGKMQGLSSGYPSVDRLTRGFVGGELTVIAGKTSKGKTTLAVNIANNIALSGKTVLFVTLEMTHAQITSRFIFLNGGNTDAYQDVSARTVFQATQDLNWKSIHGLIKQARIQMGADIVVIDHLHYFSREIEGIAEDLGRITKEFKAAAISFSIPLLLISHVRKTQNNKEATMDDLRSSSFIAQDADIVLMVGRPEGIAGDTLGIKIEKNRNRGFDYDDAEAVLNFNNTKLTEMAKKWNE